MVAKFRYPLDDKHPLDKALKIAEVAIKEMKESFEEGSPVTVTVEGKYLVFRIYDNNSLHDEFPDDWDIVDEFHEEEQIQYLRGFMDGAKHLDLWDRGD